MALKLAYTTDSGISAPNAYHRILSWHKPTESDELQFAAGIYLDQQSRIDGKQLLATRHYKLTLDHQATTNQFTQCYTHLKTLLDFAGAVDV